MHLLNVSTKDGMSAESIIKTAWKIGY